MVLRGVSRVPLLVLSLALLVAGVLFLSTPKMSHAAPMDLCSQWTEVAHADNGSPVVNMHIHLYQASDLAGHTCNAFYTHLDAFVFANHPGIAAYAGTDPASSNISHDIHFGNVPASSSSTGIHVSSGVFTPLGGRICNIVGYAHWNALDGSPWHAEVQTSMVCSN